MKKIFLSMICVLIVIFGIVPIRAKEKIKVAYPIQVGLSEYNNGAYSGYTYDYLKELERFLGMEFEFVRLSGDENEQIMTAMEKVQNGELDLLGAMAYSESLTSVYDYTAMNYGMSNMGLYVNSDNATLNDTSLYSTKSIQVGIISTKKEDNISLKEFGEMNGIQIKQHYYDSTQDLKAALDNREVDAISASDMSMIAGSYRMIATFSPRPFYFVTAKGNTKLLSSLNEAMNQLNKELPTFMSQLHSKYFSLINNDFILTSSEKQFVKDNPTISVLLLGGKAPFQSLDKDRKASGITIDLLNYIGQLTGLNFEYQYTDSYSEYTTLINSNKYMLQAGVVYPYGEIFDNYTLTKSFLESGIEIVTTKDLNPNEIKGKKLALSRGINYSGEFVGNIVYYDNALACLEAVNKGEVDYTYLNSHTALFYNGSYEYKNINIIPQEKQYSQNNCFAVRKDIPIALLNIINKGIDDASQRKTQEIIFENATLAKEDITLFSYLQKKPFEFLAIVVIICGIALFMRYLSNKKNNEKLLKEYNRYLQISDFSRDCFVEYSFKNDRLALSGGGAKLISKQMVVDNYLKTHKDKLITEHMLNQDEFEGEFYLDYLDGTKRWIKVHLQKIYDEHHKESYIIGKVTDIQEEKEEQLLWRDLAQRDSLTKLYNSAACRELISEYLMSAKDNGLALIIIDIDHFKEINDNYGHYYGDIVLQDVAKVLTHVTHPSDVVGRVGGDEFMVALKNPHSIQLVEEYCQSIMKGILDNVCADKKVVTTISIGVSISREHDSYDDLYKLADSALYDVKRRGRNGYTIANTFKQKS